MRAEIHDTTVRVVASREEVATLAAQWPLSGLPDAPLAFTFSLESRRVGFVMSVPPIEADAGAVKTLADDCRVWAQGYVDGLAPDEGAGCDDRYRVNFYGRGVLDGLRDLTAQL